MGVPFFDFFKLNNNNLNDLLLAYETKKRLDLQELSTQGWLIGLYVQMAIGSMFSKDSKYPQEPIDFIKEQKEEEVPEWVKIKEEMQRRREFNF